MSSKWCYWWCWCSFDDQILLTCYMQCITALIRNWFIVLLFFVVALFLFSLSFCLFRCIICKYNVLLLSKIVLNKMKKNIFFCNIPFSIHISRRYLRTSVCFLNSKAPGSAVPEEGQSSTGPIQVASWSRPILFLSLREATLCRWFSTMDIVSCNMKPGNSAIRESRNIGWSTKDVAFVYKKTGIKLTLMPFILCRPIGLRLCYRIHKSLPRNWCHLLKQADTRNVRDRLTMEK